jgi:mRNA interferase RelE/StbE
VTYSVSIKKSAIKALEQLPKPDRLRVIKVIDGLQIDPYSGALLKGDLSGLRRVRVGSYRVVYEVFETQLTILVVRLGHRRDIYRA